MGVLQPWLLALGAALAVPLLLHLFQRHQGPRVVFPALRYLRRAERESARRIRLRQWLLMALRLLLVLLLTLAAARPFLLGAGAAHEPAAVVIVLDNSLSTGAITGDRRVLDELRERALATVSRAGPDDRFWLLRAGAPGEPALSGDAAATAQRIRETEATSATADLRTALMRARAVLAAGAEGRAPEIQLLSDLQATELAGLAADGPAPPLVVWVPPTPAPPNHAVSEVTVAGGVAPVAGLRSQVAVRLMAGGDATDSLAVRVFADERLVAAAAAPPGASVVLPLPARTAGVLRGRVETDPDALRADDVRYFALTVLPPPAVAAPAASEFLRQALNVMEESGRIRSALPAAADVVLLSAPGAFPARRSGATVVVVPPASAVELPALNGALARAGISWRYEAAAAGGAAQLALPDSTDPLHRALAGARLELSYHLRAGRAGAAGDTVLLRTRDGAAWAVRGPLRGGGHWILLGSPLDAAATSIPTSAAMIPLLDRIVGAWSLPEGGSGEVRGGSSVALPAAATRVRRPDGVLERARGSYAVPVQTGIFEVLAGDSVLTAFAVNPPAAESALPRASERQLSAIFTGWQITTADDAAAWERAIYRARLGLELWRPLLLAALLLLALEAAVAAAGATRSTRNAAPEAA